MSFRLLHWWALSQLRAVFAVCGGAIRRHKAEATSKTRAGAASPSWRVSSGAWMITGAYLGQVLQDGMIPTSRWYDYAFVVQ